MKIAIVGSREFSDWSLITRYVNDLPADSVIVSGGARGADRTAEQAARMRGLQVEIYPAQWDAYGNGAGFIRNQQIVDAADRVVAFWDGQSRGTRDTLRKAHAARKPILIIYPDGHTWSSQL